MVLDKNRVSEALSVFLRLLVKASTGQDPKDKALDKDIRKCLAAGVTREGGVKFLLDELNVSATAPAALAFLATCIKEYGAVKEAASLYRRTVDLEPTSASYALNFSHTLEVCYELDEAVASMRNFCLQPSARGLGRGTQSSAIAPLLEDLPAFSHARGGWFWVDAGNKALVPGGAVGLWGLGAPNESEGGEQRMYSSDELDTLALLCTIVKVLYVGGAVARSAHVAALVEPARQASAQPLHSTLIRNEVAYFCCARQLLEEFPVKWDASATESSKPLYLAGDSHCLTGAWRKVSLRGETRVLTPLLST
eukprot:gene8113-9640_t